MISAAPCSLHDFQFILLQAHSTQGSLALCIRFEYLGPCSILRIALYIRHRCRFRQPSAWIQPSSLSALAWISLKNDSILRGLWHCVFYLNTLGLAVFFELPSIFATVVGSDSLQLESDLTLFPPLPRIPWRTTVLLRGLWHCVFYSNTLGLAVFFELPSIFAIVVGSDSLQLLTWLSFRPCPEFLEERQYLIVRL